MLLEVSEMDIGYAKKTVVYGLSMGIDKGEIVAIIGHNGAGKTTSLKGVFGILKPFKGQIFYNGRNIAGHSTMDNIKDGIAFLPQDRYIFPELSVRENLELGAYTIANGIEARLEIIYQLFPILEKRAWQRSSTLSGGERRMLGLGMTLITTPQLLILDEPSLGLSPIFVTSVLKALQEIRDGMGTSVILVEQNVKKALELAHRVYVMKLGRIILEESGEVLLQRGAWWDLF
jgi:branched-chain amino acid transport system ATP-binding protein